MSQNKSGLSEIEFCKKLRKAEDEKLAELSKDERIAFLVKEDDDVLAEAKKLGIKTLKLTKVVQDV